jgi:predicted methyltransferase
MKKISRANKLSVALCAFALFSIEVSSVYAADFLDAALSAPERKKSDKNRDPLRKPAEVLRFFGVKEGDTVLDVFSGGGYYTEILSRAVGENGAVTAHNNQAYLRIMRYDLETRYDDNRLNNVELLQAEPEQIRLDNNRYDFAIMALAYHDFYINTDDWPEFDVKKMLSEIFKGMKSGGIVGIVDHVALAGSGYEAAQKLHRIDPDIVKEEMIAVGFVLEGQSDILVNTSDPHDVPMWDPSVRGRTDRFIMKFRKP